MYTLALFVTLFLHTTLTRCAVTDVKNLVIRIQSAQVGTLKSVPNVRALITPKRIALSKTLNYLNVKTVSKTILRGAEIALAS